MTMTSIPVADALVAVVSLQLMNIGLSTLNAYRVGKLKGRVE